MATVSCVAYLIHELNMYVETWGEWHKEPVSLYLPVR